MRTGCVKQVGVCKMERKQITLFRNIEPYLVSWVEMKS